MLHSIVDSTKSAAHWLIDITFPRTSAIATLSGLASLYGYNYGMTNSQGFMVTKVNNALDNVFPSWISWGLAHFGSPLFVPSVAPQISLALSIGTGCATSVTLNLLHIAMTKTSNTWKKMFSNEEDDAEMDEGKPGSDKLKRTIEIPIYSPHSIHGIYFQKV